MGTLSKIQDTWNENAEEWVRIIETQGIASRKFTNKAIAERLLQLPITKILDCGCGEGWLSRTMTSYGKDCNGFDFTAKLISTAQKNGPEFYFLMDYETLSKEKTVPKAPYDAMVFNFSLYAKDGVSALLNACGENLRSGGYVVIQTLHPHFLRQQGLPEESQWITDSWKGLPGNFTNGHRWYARTLEDWHLVFERSKLRLSHTLEVTNEQQHPLSILFTLKTPSHQ